MAFVDQTRQNERRGGRVDYIAGGVGQYALPMVGYMAHMHVLVSGTMTITPGTGTAVLSEKGPYNLIRRLRYEIGSGTNIYNVSGWGAYLVELNSKLNRQPENGKIDAAYEDEIFSCPVASGDNDWHFGFTIPIVPNERDINGLILLQAQGTVTQLIFEWANAGGATHADFPVVTTGNATASFVGNASVYLETFTVPALVDDQPTINEIHQVFERVDPINNTGETSIKLLEENTYLRIIHSVELNGRLNTTDVERRLLRYNITDVPYDLELDADLYLARKRWNRDFPVGVFTWELFDQGYPNYGGDRDLIMASGLAELESVFYIASDANLGSGNSLIRTIQQQLVPVASGVR